MRAEPQFRFRVVLETDDEEARREYIWPLPANHRKRLVASLWKWVNERFCADNAVLPAFSAPFVAELFMAKDEEEAARLLELCLGNRDSKIVNLLSVVDGLPLKEEGMVNALSTAYQKFATACLKRGFYSALKEHYQELRTAYRDLVREYLSMSEKSNWVLFFQGFPSYLSPMLRRIRSGMTI